jgi:hypothetical protein
MCIYFSSLLFSSSFFLCFFHSSLLRSASRPVAVDAHGCSAHRVLPKKHHFHLTYSRLTSRCSNYWEHPRLFTTIFRSTR